MDHLIRDVQGAVGAGNWYAAVALALALPDSCAAIDQPGVRGRQRYIEWADSYIVDPYFSSPEGQPYLTGRELYLLRCAFLHAGELELEEPEPTEANDGLAMFEVLNRVYLYVSDVGVVASRGMTSTTGNVPTRKTSYSVSVHDFCDGICQGASNWLVRARADALKRQRIDAGPRIMRLGLDGCSPL